MLGAGTHNHAQGYAFSAAGVYDVTFVGWDVNGKYADSAPVTVRFEAVPAPGVSAGLAMGGIALMRRRRQPDPDIA